MTGHLLYWGNAIIIYPLCESNVYVVSPDAPTHANSALVEKFSEHFPGESLFQVSTNNSFKNYYVVIINYNFEDRHNQ